MTSSIRRVRSPFVDHRWENQDTRHFFYLETQEYRDIVDDDRHTFLIGHRGTGKTTILKALHWEERAHNPALRRALGSDDPFPDGIVGCYMNLKLVALPVFDGWLQNETDASKHLLFSSYLRLFWIELAARAVKYIIRNAKSYTLDHEVQELGFCGDAITAWIDRVSVEAYANTPTEPLTLRNLETIAASMRDYIWNAANLGLASPTRVAEALNLHRLLDVTNRSFRALSKLLNAVLPGREWTFRICLDEGEHLSREAALSIRSMVRECESPLVMAVAALGNLGVDTIRPSVNLSTSDRKIIDLDQRSRSDFIDLINGILKERIFQWSGDDVRVDLEEILGNPSLNELLVSCPGEGEKLVAIRAKWRGQLHADPDSLHTSGTGPIYDFMLSEGWIDQLSKGKRRRRDASVGYRKYITQAYFGVLRDAGVTRPYYAGIGIAVAMADNSIKDALIFVNDCFERYRKSSVNQIDLNASILRFVSRRVPLAQQNRALEHMGRRKTESDMPIKLQSDRDNAARMVRFFGRLSHELTFNGSRTEKGAFLIRLLAPSDGVNATEVMAEQRLFVETVRICAREGFMRIVAEDPATGEFIFRMHRSLASSFAFTFRRPSYTTPVPWEVVREAWLASDQKLMQLAQSHANRVNQQSKNFNDRHPNTQDSDQVALFEIDEE